MSGLQGWFFLLLLAALAARGFGAVQLHPRDLRVVGAAMAIALLQRLVVGQVALDDPFFSPLLMAFPLVVALRGELRDGLSAAMSTWLTLAVVAGAVPVEGRGEISQDGFVLAAVFSLLLSGIAAGITPDKRRFGPLLAIAWGGYFAMRDVSLVTTSWCWGVLCLAVGWTYVGAFYPPLAPSRSPT